MEENFIMTPRNFSNEINKDTSNLKFQFNKNFFPPQNKQFNKGKTITTFNNSNKQKIKEELEKFGSSLASAEIKNNPRFSKKLSRNNLLSNRGKNRLKKYSTFTENNIKMIQQFGNKTNFNINININKIEIEKPTEKEEAFEENKNVVKTNDSNKTNKKLFKIKNLVKLVRGIIEPDSQLTNHIKERKIKSAERSNQSQNKCNSSFIKFMEKPEMEKEFIRVHLKERVLKIITEGAYKISIREDIEQIFSKNYDRFVYDHDNPKFLFNQHMSDGKTLFYYACLEGNLEVVKVFLDKNLNPSILSKNEYNEYETCLQVSARWGYNEIVNLILEKRGHVIKNEELENTLKIKNLKSSIRKILKSHFKNKKGKGGCACF